MAAPLLDPRASSPKCFPCSTLGCPDAVVRAPWGRFVVTMGHPAFNSPTNNRSGYKTYAAAVKAVAAKGKK